MLRRRGGHASEGGRLYRLVERGYGRVLAWSLRHRWVIVLVAIAIVLATGPLFGRVGKTFLPQDDQSEFEISIRTPGGFTLAETSRLFAEIEHRVRALRGVTDVLATIGDTSGRVKAGEGDVTSGSIYARMVDLRARRFSQFDVMADARHLLTEYPDLRASVQGVNPFSTGGQRLSDVELNLRGPDLGRLQTYADRLMAGMRELPGLVDVDTTLAVRTPELITAGEVAARAALPALRAALAPTPTQPSRARNERIRPHLPAAGALPALDAREPQAQGTAGA